MSRKADRAERRLAQQEEVARAVDSDVLADMAESGADVSGWSIDDEEDEYAAEEEAIAAQMAPEPEDIPEEDRFCGQCGSDQLGDRPIIRAPYREGGSPWIRCTSCTQKWRAERGEQERREKALRASKIHYKAWRWIRSQYDSTCIFCNQPILTGEKVRYAPGCGAVHGGCKYAEQLKLVETDDDDWIDGDTGRAA